MRKTTNNNKSSKSLSLIGLIGTGALFTVLFSFASLLDHHHRYFELLSHFKLQYLCICAVGLIIFVLRKDYLMTVALASGLALNAYFVLPWYLPVEHNVIHDTADTTINASIHDTATELTIIHSNVLSHNDQFDNFMALIQQNKPDIFVMQEVNQRWIDATLALTKLYPHHHTIARNDNFGIALFSKRPFVSVEQISWGDARLPSIKASIAIEQQIITIVTTHPLPPVGHGYYVDRNNHIKEMAEALHAQNKQQDPLIVIGDLNVSMWSHDYQPLENQTGLRNARRGFGVVPTWPTQLLPFMIPIDHCLVSSHFVVNDLSAGPNIGSDHLPLIVKLGLIAKK